MSYRGQYFVVRNGKELRSDYSNVKFTKTRVFSGNDACIQTFGYVSPMMFVKGVGVNKQAFATFKGRMSFIEDPDSWISMTEDNVPTESISSN